MWLGTQAVSDTGHQPSHEAFGLPALKVAVRWGDTGAFHQRALLPFSQDCGKPLSIEADDNGCFPLDGHVLCRKCHTARAQT